METLQQHIHIILGTTKKRGHRQTPRITHILSESLSKDLSCTHANSQKYTQPVTQEFASLCTTS